MLRAWVEDLQGGSAEDAKWGTSRGGLGGGG